MVAQQAWNSMHGGTARRGTVNCSWAAGVVGRRCGRTAGVSFQHLREVAQTCHSST